MALPPSVGSFPGGPQSAGGLPPPPTSFGMPRSVRHIGALPPLHPPHRSGVLRPARCPVSPPQPQHSPARHSALRELPPPLSQPRRAHSRPRRFGEAATVALWCAGCCYAALTRLIDQQPSCSPARETLNFIWETLLLAAVLASLTACSREPARPTSPPQLRVGSFTSDSSNQPFNAPLFTPAMAQQRTATVSGVFRPPGLSFGGVPPATDGPVPSVTFVGTERSGSTAISSVAQQRPSSVSSFWNSQRLQVPTVFTPVADPLLELGAGPQREGTNSSQPSGSPREGLPHGVSRGTSRTGTPVYVPATTTASVDGALEKALQEALQLRAQLENVREQLDDSRQELAAERAKGLERDSAASRAAAADAMAAGGRSVGDSTPMVYGRGAANEPPESTLSYTRGSVSFFSQNTPCRGAMASPMTPAVPSMFSSWAFGRPIGRGASCLVSRALNKSTGRFAAAKRYDGVAREPGALMALKREAELLEVLCGHEGIVRLLDTIWSESAGRSTYVVFQELGSLGSLRGVIDEFGPLPDGAARTYSRQLMLALSFLHQQQLLHRDIKAANVVVQAPGVCKFCDFGEACHVATLRAVKSDSDTVVSMSRAAASGAVHGSALWMAPEVLRGEQHRYSSDVWSLGATIHEMITGDPPRVSLLEQCKHGEMQLLFMLAAEGAPELPYDAGLEAQDLLSKCWAHEPRQRWSAEQLLAHPWLEEVPEGTNSPGTHRGSLMGSDRGGAHSDSQSKGLARSRVRQVPSVSRPGRRPVAQPPAGLVRKGAPVSAGIPLTAETVESTMSDSILVSESTVCLSLRLLRLSRRTRSVREYLDQCTDGPDRSVSSGLCGSLSTSTATRSGTTWRPPLPGSATVPRAGAQPPPAAAVRTDRAVHS
eukprot:TRINITY_DN70094_c0_g1_i1.p1 TRINITY_DN70094_c0_g1~~TRINITY_DN70094_c0_g1_i1.p1  ORF type:complete len:884 (+),score=187.89 TRINITY_DN70094_c0_g1_i1:89-2740(+)